MLALDVYLHRILAGRVTTEADGKAAFEYDGDYAASSLTPVSLSFSRSGTSAVGAWIDGLLPDNESVRSAWAEHHRARSSRPADLLATPVGLDCAGAVQFVPAGDPLPGRGSGSRPLTENEIADWIRSARRDWGTWGGTAGLGGQFSLAGAQAKCALRLGNGQWSQPHGDSPSTHILKPGLDRYPDAEAVEHVCLAAARRLGLTAAHSELERFEDQRVVVVTRFDRHAAVDGDEPERIHQEDMCQALSVPPSRKYQSDGGPSPQDVARLLRGHAAESDTRRFLDALIYNWAIAAPDAHAKNYSVALAGDRVALTPMYDVISYLPYAEGTPHRKLRTAMRTGRDYTLRKADRASAWQRLAEGFGLDPDETVERAASLARRVPAAISDSIDAMSAPDRASPVISELHKQIGIRARSAAAAIHHAPQHSPSRAVSAGRRKAQTVDVSVLCRGGDSRAPCGRTLRHKPCPLHPGSPGSRTIAERAQHRASTASAEAAQEASASQETQ